MRTQKIEELIYIKNKNNDQERRLHKVVYKNPDCMGHYDFEHIVQFAKMRFIDGHSTINLLMQAQNEIEREEVALVCMLDIDDDIVTNIELSCRYSHQCQVKDCRDRLRSLIEARLKN